MIKSTKKRRIWDAAREKINREGACRVCKTSRTLQASHTICRSKQDIKDGNKVIVKADSVVPLCQPCHEAYDQRCLSLLPYLNLWEQIDAVEAAGGIERARNRLMGGRA